jgi:hypothetical protein
MERFKENVELQKEKNLVSSVLMVCFLLFAIFVWSAFSVSDEKVTDSSNNAQVLATLGK